MPKSKIYSADLETDPFEHGHFPRPFWAGFFDGHNHKTFWGSDCISRFVNAIWDLKGIMYFHNGGKFDFHYLLAYLPDELEIFMIGERLVSIKFRDLELRDSFAIIPTSLSSGGEKSEVDYDKFRPEKREEHREEIEEYARQDNVALWNLVTRFIENYGAYLTLASAAFKQLQNLGINPPKGTEKMDEKLRPFYYGGRVQCFEYGEIKPPCGVKIVDINSAYPYAMLHKHCFDQSFHKSKNPPKNIETYRASFFAVKCSPKGCFPKRSKDGIHFPFGVEDVYFVTGWEMESAIETDSIENYEIQECWKPNTLIDFSVYVEKFYREKLAAQRRNDTQARMFAKLMLNSVYGKFAINPRNFRDYELCPIGERVEGAKHKCDLDEAGFAVWAKEIEENKLQSAFKNVGTAASITGFVRAYLWRALCQVERPIYCDTDSIACADTGDLPMNDDLGGWSTEGEGESIHVAGKKLYSLIGYKGETLKLASKGVRASHEDISRAIAGEDVNIKNPAPTYSLSTGGKFISRKIRKTIDIDSPNPFI